MEGHNELSFQLPMVSVLYVVVCEDISVFSLTLFLKPQIQLQSYTESPIVVFINYKNKTSRMRRIGKSFRWYIIWFGHYQASKKFVFSRFAQCTVGDFLSLMNLSSTACGLAVTGSTSFHINVFFCICWRTLSVFLFLQKTTSLKPWHYL